MDITLTIPAFPLLLVLVALFRGASGILFMAAILSVNAWAGLARAIGSRVLGIKEREFVEAAKCLGLGNLRLIFREILPNLMGYIVIILITGVTGAIYAEVALFTFRCGPILTGKLGGNAEHGTHACWRRDIREVRESLGSCFVYSAASDRTRFAFILP